MSFNEFTILIYDIIYVNLLYEYLHKVPSSYCAYRNIYRIYSINVKII